MKPLKINLLSTTHHHLDEPREHKPRPWTSFAILLMVFLFSFGIGRVTYSQDGRLGWIPIDDIPLFGQVRNFVMSADRSLAGEDEDRVNILLLGIGGEGHEAPNLSDTIILMSIKPSTNQVALLSIPRDLLIPVPGQGWKKINSANAYGEQSSPGRGGEFARSTIEGLLGMDIPYYVRIDFGGFEKFIDSVGGVDITVERSFVDTTYPTNNYGIQTISFKQGAQTMNGKTALQFVRSRHGNNGEGSDFARARRQQKVLSSLKEKLLSLQTFRNPSMISNVLATLRANISTNLQIGEILRLAKIGQQVDRNKIGNKVLDDSPGSPLVSSVYGGAYVLVPRNDDWSALRTAAASILATTSSTTNENAAVVTNPTSATTTVEIQNGTSKTGQAREIASKLTNSGFTITKIGNADENYQKTTLYVFNTAASTRVQMIKQIFPAALVVTRPPSALAKSVRPTNADGTPGKSPDLLLVLGADEL